MSDHVGCRLIFFSSVVDNYFSRFVGSHTGNPNAVLATRKIDVFTLYYLAKKILISILYIHTYN